MNYLGAHPGPRVQPKGYIVRPELVEAFGDLYSANYVSPPYTKAMNYAAFERYEQVATSINTNVLHKATSWACNEFRASLTAPFPSHDQVISNLDLRTSTGIAVSEMGMPTKSHVAENVGFDWLLVVWAAVLNGFRWAGVFKNFLKEELRKRGKDTRGILSGPLDLVYCMSRVFLNQNQGFYRDYLITSSAVGVSRDHLEWHRIYQKLKKFPRGAACDVKKFDARMCDPLMRSVAHVRKASLTNDQRWAIPIIDWFYDILINTVCWVNGYLFQKSGGNPTGSVNTVVDNTIALFIVLCYAFIVLNPQASYSDFKEWVVLVLYGDDNTYSYNEDQCSYAPEDIARVVYEAFGYEVTIEAKGPVEVLNFLSADFKLIDYLGAKIAVPSFDRDKIICHIVEAQKCNPFIEFQRMCALRAIMCFDDEVVDILDQWILAHKEDVTSLDFVAMFKPITEIRAGFFYPKTRDSPHIKGSCNDFPLYLSLAMQGTYTKNILSKLESAGALTPGGVNYLKMALDPFPDQEHPIVGMPDGSAGRSCVQQYNQTITVTAPPGLASTATWDCHVAFLPELCDAAWNVANNATGYGGAMCVDATSAYLITNPSTTTNNFPWRAPVHIMAVPSGTATFPTSTTSPYAAASTSIQGFDLSGYVGPQSRVIGGGFEVVNTTPELYRGGAVVYYTQPAEFLATGSTVLDASDSTSIPQWGQYSVVTRCPPANIANAISIPGSVKRGAEEGCYIPIRLAKGQNNPPIEPLRQRRLFMYKGGLQGGWGFGVSNPKTTVASFPPYSNLAFHQAIPYDTSGAYFTGLNANSSLDVTLRLFIEVFPTPNANQSLVSLTVPCPPEDPLACEIYSRVCATLPPGVPVAENEKGTWWKNVLGTIASVAPTIGSALGTVIPGAGLIGRGVGGVAEMLSAMKLGEKAQKEVDKRALQIAKRAPTALLSPNARKKGLENRKKRRLVAKAAASSSAGPRS